MGEFVLERLLDKANLMKGVHYDTQVSMNVEEEDCVLTQLFTCGDLI
ncbi:MAG: hypothetical protein R3D88_03970 [Alphaproteobacteria bacterium]